MKILRLVLGYETGDAIYVDKIEDLERFDLSKVKAIEVRSSMTLEEFQRFRGMGQVITSETSTGPSSISVSLGQVDPRP